MLHSEISDTAIRSYMNEAHLARSKAFHSLVKAVYGQIKNLIVKPISVSTRFYPAQSHR
jgi:hypothetical protein